MDLFDKTGVKLPVGPDFSHEQALLREMQANGLSGRYICGVDEVGRGPLAGPVVAAAVILDPESVPQGLNDSKKLSAKRREALAEDIMDMATAFHIAEVGVADIDRINILQAAMLAMRRAVQGLSVRPDAAIVDGNKAPDLDGVLTKTLIKGDARSLSVAAASIIAKVFRDQLMAKLAIEHPSYGWEKNAGYGVPHHLAALKLVGVSPYHRKSFAPIREILDEKNTTKY